MFWNNVCHSSKWLIFYDIILISSCKYNYVKKNNTFGGQKFDV